ncbi:MAG: oligosaccharide flippase family protein [Pseudooceanicola nanhaiensis]
MLRSAMLIVSGNAANSALLLVRNLLVARLIPVEDYGIAATFAMAMGVIEMVSSFGLQQQIVQARDGDDPRLQAALQGFQVMRGLFTGGVLFVSAGALADFMNLEHVAPAYRVMALVPIIRSFQHFDIHRMNRRMIYLPLIATNLLPALVSVLLIWPLVMWLGDYRVMLSVIMVQAVVSLLISHAMAERPWRATLDRGMIARSMRFGWPIMLNSMLLFAVFNGDRIFVGREMGPAVLAIFSMGITLTLTPTLVFARSMQNFFLPQLSRLEPSDGDAETFARFGTIVIELVLLASLVFVVGAMILGRPVVHLLLGENYHPLLPLIALFAIGQGFRMLKIGPAIVALSVARTGNAAIGNIPRLLSLPLVWWIAATSGNLTWIVLLMISAEIAGCLLVFGVLWPQVPLRRGELLRVHALALPAIGLAAWQALRGPDLHLPAVPGWEMSLALVLVLLPPLLGMSALREYLGLDRRKVM